MWISRKKWEDMENKVDAYSSDIASLKYLVECLIKIHESKDEPLRYIDPFTNDCNILFHTKSKVQTKTIPNLTLEELAQYVIDNKPIVREKNVKVRKEYR